ncbi:MAG: RICIN domain-containing protein, partial [bacterium]
MKVRQARSVVLGCALAVTSLTCGVADDELATSEDVSAITTFNSTAVAQHSARCMDVFGAGAGNDVNLIQWNCHAGANQSFTFTPVSGTTDQYNINTFTAGKCVEVSGASTADNARVVQNPCSTATSQRFRLVAVTVSGTDKTFNIQAVHSNKCIGANGAVTDNGATLVQVPCSGALDRVFRVPNFVADGGPQVFETLPNLPVNACNNTSLPKSFGTNFPTPRDPFAFGFFDQSAIGWQGNWYPVFAYLSGSYFARGVPTTFTQGSTSLCGA